MSSRNISIEACYNLKDGRTGIVRFYGETDFVAGKLVGLQILTKEFDSGHDGIMNEKRYFKCPMGKGVFVRPKQLDDLIPPKIAKKLLLESTNQPKWKPPPEYEEEREGAAKPKSIIPKVGCYYLCQNEVIAIVRFWGTTRWSKQKICGLQIVQGEVHPDDANDGMGPDGKRYFKAPHGTGVFVSREFLIEQLRGKQIPAHFGTERTSEKWSPPKFSNPEDEENRSTTDISVVRQRSFGPRDVGRPSGNWKPAKFEEADESRPNRQERVKIKRATGPRDVKRDKNWKPANFEEDERKPARRREEPPKGALKGKYRNQGPRNVKTPQNWKTAKFKDPKKSKFLRDQALDDIENPDVMLYEMFGIWEDGVNLIYDEEAEQDYDEEDYNQEEIDEDEQHDDEQLEDEQHDDDEFEDEQHDDDEQAANDVEEDQIQDDQVIQDEEENFESTVDTGEEPIKGPHDLVSSQSSDLLAPGNTQSQTPSIVSPIRFSVIEKAQAGTPSEDPS